VSSRKVATVTGAFELPPTVVAILGDGEGGDKDPFKLEFGLGVFGGSSLVNDIRGRF
jgi:hypothetical protein